MARKHTSPKFRQDIATCLKTAIRENGLRKSKAAELLGVKRQTLWLYLTGKSAPGPEVLRKASKLWKLSLSSGYVVNSAAFGPEKKPQAHPKQLDLFKALDEIRPNQITTSLIGRVGKFYEFRVRIKIAS